MTVGSSRTPTPEIVSALEEAIRDAQQLVDDAEEAKKKRRRNRPSAGDRKFPEHLPRYERIVDLPEEKRAGLVDKGSHRWCIRILV